MKTLRLTIALEPGLSKASLKNVFGHYDMFYGKHHRFVQFTFPNVKMISPIQLKPIYALLSTFELKQPLTFKMFHLHDDTDNTFSPTRIMCDEGTWTLESVGNDKIIATGKTLFDLF